MTKTLSFLLRWRYLISCLVLAAVMALWTSNGCWEYDFWEHSAVVRELTIHPFSPEHPLLQVDAPHAFLSPYHLGVALCARLLQWNPIGALSVAGMLNLVLFLFGLRFFLIQLFPQQKDSLPFYSLLLILLMWPRPIWNYSGFFNLRFLGFHLPNSSTFAAGLSLVALGMYITSIKRQQPKWLFPTFAFCIITLLTHPLTFIFLSIGLGCLWLGESKNHLRDIGFLAMGAVVTVLAALLYPYFPFFTLILKESGIYDAHNFRMYQEPFLRLYPVLLGLIPLFFRIKTRWRDSLGMMVVLLSAVYIYGWLSERWSYGRIISFAAIVLQINIAYMLSSVEMKLNWRRFSVELQRAAYAVAVLLLSLGLAFHSAVWPALLMAKPDRPNTYEKYRFLADHTGQYDVVLSDTKSSWPIPTFGGKIVATRHPQAFIPDYWQRVSDLKRFFLRKETCQFRMRMVTKYRANHLLIPKLESQTMNYLSDHFSQCGKTVYSSRKWILISLPENPAESENCRCVE